jgi:hypothetical protein
MGDCEVRPTVRVLRYKCELLPPPPRRDTGVLNERLQVFLILLEGTGDWWMAIRSRFALRKWLSNYVDQCPTGVCEIFHFLIIPFNILMCRQYHSVFVSFVIPSGPLESV